MVLWLSGATSKIYSGMPRLSGGFKPSMGQIANETPYLADQSIGDTITAINVSV